MAAGWIPALLFAMAIAMTWANRPLQKPAGVKEGFNNRIVMDVAGKELWFAEKVIGGDPQEIVQDRVDTDAVQSSSQKGNSRTSK